MFSSRPFVGSPVVAQKFGANQRAFSRLSYAGVRLRGHNGIDFSLEVGTPVFSVQNGVVLDVGDDPTGYGLYIVVGHRWGHTLYGHLSRADVRKAQQIDASTQIGLSGSSGAAAEPHLHFGMRIVPFSVRDGWCGFSDPAPYLARLSSPRGAIIGPHIIGGIHEHLDLLATWQPRMVLVLDPNPDEMRAMRTVCPDTTIVGRLFFDTGELTRRIATDPAAAASWVHQKTLQFLPSEVNYWQAANEILQDEEGLPLLARFEQQRMMLADEAGYLCAIFGFSVGNPDLPEDDRMALWRHCFPAMEQAETSGHIIALHQYGMPNLWGPDRQYDWYIHRLEHQVLRMLPFKQIKFAVTEFGIDGLIRNTKPSGWRDFTDPVNYVEQLLRAGRYLERFSGRVLGYTVFTLGHHVPWESYEIRGTAASLLAERSDRGTWRHLSRSDVDIVPGQTDTTAEPGPHTRVASPDDPPDEEDGDMNPIDGLVDRRLSRAFDDYNMQIRALTDRPDSPQGDTVYLVKDVFTTVNGSWDAQGNPADVPDWARQDYLRPEFLEAGANHHLFAAVFDENGQLVRSHQIRYWSDGYEQLADPSYAGYVHEQTKESSGWANMFIGPGSSFAPDRGERGPWCWMPEGASEVFSGGGLPFGHTVSTFVVWQAVSRQAWEEWINRPDKDPDEPDPDQPNPDDDTDDSPDDDSSDDDSGSDDSDADDGESDVEDDKPDDTQDPDDAEPNDGSGDNEDDKEPDTDPDDSNPAAKVVRRASPWIGSYNLTIKRLDERPDAIDADTVFIIKDVFTTRRGSWEPSEERGSVPEWARDDYLKEIGAPDYFDDAGGDHHLFAAVLGPDGQLIRRQPILYWSDGFEKLGDETFRDYVWRITKERSGWANIPIGPGSSYVPERDESGPWCWAPVGAAEVMCGGGLPANHHISVFVVWQAVKSSQASEDDSEDTAQDDEDESTHLPVIGSDTGRTNSPRLPNGLDPKTQLAVRKAAWGNLNPEYDSTTDLAEYARRHNLGVPLTHETQSDGFIVQGFQNGIVYAPAHAPRQCRHIPW